MMLMPECIRVEFSIYHSERGEGVCCPRIWRHHLPLLLLSFACVAVLYQTRPYPDVIEPGKLSRRRIRRSRCLPLRC